MPSTGWASAATPPSAVHSIAYSIGMMATETLASLVLKELGFFGTLPRAGIGLLICTPFLQKDMAEDSAARNGWIRGQAGEST
jgi:hypothetical protein